MKITHKHTGAVVDTTKAFAERRKDRWDLPGADPPNKSDTKDNWVDYAVSQGMDRDDAEAATKADLMAKFGD